MSERLIEAIVERRAQGRVPLHSLMSRKVYRVLLVSSLYDSYTFGEEGQLSEIVFADYLELNLSAAPRVERVTTAEEAVERLKEERFDLVIAMLRMGRMDLEQFGRSVARTAPGVPVILLAASAREVSLIESLGPLANINRVFLWNGDQKLFFAIIKYIEDSLNVTQDTATAGVQVIILIEDSVRFYSTYLPMLYTELVKQTQHLMSDVVNMTQKLVRMRARPKLLLAGTYEEAEALYAQYKDHVLGVITDVAYSRDGRPDPRAGLDFAAMVRADSPDRPVLIQSSDETHAAFAAGIGARFIHKHSASLLEDVRHFMQDHLGFGDFVFRLADQTEVGRATDLRSLADGIRRIPEESLLYHSRRNHFSTWLMARTEFDLARALRPQQVEDFSGPEALRDYLCDAIEQQRRLARAGVVAEFSRDRGDVAGMFVRIGSGSLGGKGRGLAFMDALFTTYKILEHIPGVRILVPPTAILASGVFDAFMERNSLKPAVLHAGVTDEEVTRRFVSAPFPEDAVANLRAFLERIHYPLAVRSSSLLEDACFQPFAGVYRTYMIPNNHPELEVRLRELLFAIRLVYASTYYEDARCYIEATPNRLEEEKMAIVIQQVVGRRHGHYLYPDIAGTARSRNFYPMEGMTAEDGLASVAFGFGNLVVDGGRCLRFSPAHPQRLYQFSSVQDCVRTAQREFYALDLSRPGPTVESAFHRRSSLSVLGLDTAEEHGTLDDVASVYSSDNQAIYDGISRAGVRLVTMAGVLKYAAYPLPEVISFLLRLGEAGFSTPVEIEFAATLPEHPGEPAGLGFLQVRPLVGGPEIQQLNIQQVRPQDAICLSTHALGHGIAGDLHDVVYVKPDTFSRSRTVTVATEIGLLNARLRAEKRPYILIGQGRWGSADRWLGIPVSWSQVSGVGCFVETDLQDVSVEPSQGTHFFQNITSLGIGYLTVNFGAGAGFVDYPWLDAQPAATETGFVRHVTFDQPVQVAVDSRSGRGVIMKPGLTASRKA